MFWRVKTLQNDCSFTFLKLNCNEIPFVPIAGNIIARYIKGYLKNHKNVRDLDLNSKVVNLDLSSQVFVIDD